MKKRYILQALVAARSIIKPDMAYICLSSGLRGYYFTSMDNATIMDKKGVDLFLKDNPGLRYVLHTVVEA